MTTSILLLSKATVVLIVALSLDAWLRKRRVLACAAMWEAVLVALLLLPIAAMTLSTLRLPPLRLPVESIARMAVHDKPSAADERWTAAPREQRAGSDLEPAAAAAREIQAPATTSFTTQDGGKSMEAAAVWPSLPSVGLVMIAIYLTGCVTCLIHLAMALVGAARLRSSGDVLRCDDWNRRLRRWQERLGCGSVELRESNNVQVPLMVGYFRPAILIPQRMVAETDERSRDAVLVHELGHVLRGDFGWQVILHFLKAVLWFHPLIWVAQRRIQFIRERACDDFAVHALGSSKEYIDVLLAIAGRLIKQPSLGLGLAVLRTPNIAARLEAAADSEGSPLCRLSFRKRFAILIAVFLAGGVVAGIAIEAKQNDQESDQKPTPIAVAEAIPGVISGEVVLAEGNTPVSGATVLIIAGHLRRETTDENGRFKFSDIAQRDYQIWAFKEPLASPKQHVVGVGTNIDAKPVFAPIRLALSPGKQIKVTVTSALNGQLLEGAKVVLGYPDRQTKITGKDGTAVLQALLPQPYDMTVQATGYAREIRDIDLKSADQVTIASVSLARGGTIRGTVTNEDQVPLANADVSFRTPASPVGFYGESPYADEQGRYNSLYLPLNTPIQVSVGQNDHLGQRQEVTLTEQQPNIELNVQLKKRPLGVTVSGIVTDAAGKPIAGATIFNFGYRYDERREAKSDELGKFTLKDVTNHYAGYELIVKASGYVPVRQKFEPNPTDGSTMLSIKLETGHFIRGRVQDKSGKPIPGAYVDINGGSTPDNLGEFLITDRDGQFQSDSLPLPSRFRFRADGYSATAEMPLTLDGNEPVVVTLETAGVVRGRVVDAATGAAIEQFRVRFTFSTDVQPGDVRASYRASLNEPGTTFHAKDGAFVIRELTNRMAFQVVADAVGYEPATVPRVVAQQDDAAKPVTIALKKKELLAPAVVTGTVVDAAGKPVAGVQLRLIVSTTPSDGEDDNRFNWVLIETGDLASKSYVEQYLSTVTNSDGKFELRDILPGKYPQIAYWGERAPKGRTLALAKTKPGGSQSITIQLPKPATIRGSFDDKAFFNASKVSLMFQTGSFQSYDFAISKGKSDFEFGNLPPGRYWLSVIGQPERDKDNPQMFSLRPLASRMLTVEPGETLDIKLTKDDQTKGANR